MLDIIHLAVLILLTGGPSACLIHAAGRRG